MMNNTVYANLSRDFSGLDQFKRSVENQLGSVMPEELIHGHRSQLWR